MRVAQQWERDYEYELERRWRAYKRRQSYRYATVCTIAGLCFMAWLVYCIAR